VYKTYILSKKTGSNNRQTATVWSSNQTCTAYSHWKLHVSASCV